MKIIPITEGQTAYAGEIKEQLSKLGIRAEADVRDEKMQKKIRDAEIAKIPYMAIIGKREAEAGTISIRSRKKGDLGAMNKDAFIELLQKEIAEKQ